MPQAIYRSRPVPTLPSAVCPLPHPPRPGTGPPTAPALTTGRCSPGASCSNGRRRRHPSEGENFSLRRQQSTWGNIIRIVLLLNTEPRGQCLVMEGKCLPSPWAASPRPPLRPTRDHPRASGQEEGGAAAGGGTGRQGGLGK